MNSLNKIFALLILVCFITSAAFAQTQEPIGDEMRNLLKNEPFSVGLLLQSTANFSLSDDGFNSGRRFGLGATRLKVSGNVDDGFIYNLQMDFRRASSVVDAAVGYRTSEKFQLKAGLQKPDIGLDLKPSPGDTDFINRARLIGAMLNTREVGVSFQGQSNGFDYNVAVFNGTGFSLSNDDRFMYLAKVGYLSELERDGSLYFGVNGALNSTENQVVGNTGLNGDDRLIYGAHVRYDSNEWFGAAEFLQTKFNRGLPDDEVITGFYATIGNKVTDKSELLARWDHLSYREIDESSNQAILGWNYQATSLISFQLNFLGEFTGEEESFGLAGNFQFQF